MKKSRKSLLAFTLGMTMAFSAIGLSACDGTKRYAVSIVDESNGAYGRTIGEGSYEENTQVSLLASTNQGYVFAGWQNNATGKYVSRDSVYTFTVKGDVRLSPRWVKITATGEYTWCDGRTGEDCYDASLQTRHFFSDREDAVTYFANAMYADYGYIGLENRGGNYVGVRVGWTPAWFEWIALIRGWSDNQDYHKTWREFIINQPICPNGFVWAYDSPHWPNMGGVGCHNYHYDSNFRYITTICNFVGWENSLAILDEVDQKDGPNIVDAGQEAEVELHKAEDVSKGMTLGAKLDLTVNYVLNDLEGKNGLIIIDEDDNDGLNLGTTSSYSCNYWDNIPFGYKSAYENILFYNSLKALVQLETFRGNAQKAQYYSDLMATVKQKYNETFWDEETGRYIATVDINGVRRDYGVTFVNMEAVSAGLASVAQAKSIYDWIDGKRIVQKDKEAEEQGLGKTGSAIYDVAVDRHGEPVNGRVVPVTNTISFGVQTEVDGEYWWHDNGGSQGLSWNGKYGGHVENGGAILYTEFYDIMGRIQMGDVSSAYNRFEVLAKEYAKDELNRDPMNFTSGGRDVLGFIGEFPESGIVPTAYLYGFIGLNQMAGGLRFTPNIPGGYKYMGVNNVQFGGQNYTFTAYADGRFALESVSGLNLLTAVKDTMEVGSRTLTFYNASGEVVESRTVTVQNGEFTLDTRGVAGAVKAVLA